MPTLVLLWVWFCAFLNCAGWTLSALHQLNAGGYFIALLLWFVALFIWKQKTAAHIFPHAWLKKISRRCRKLFPAGFLILATLAFLGGALHAPTNYDGLAYRIPRVLHWLADGQWHWIHTIFPRLNQRACGIEWLSAPVIALLKSDRPLFLINFISFIFLPGLVFSIFTRLGVRSRVAWLWMWLVPTGYCFLLQAGSIGTDLFGALFVLAALDFALRAKVSGAARDFFAAALAAGLMTSAKPSNLPLLLPWAIAILPSAKLILRWPLRTMAVAVIALAASYVPTAVLNLHFCGDWTGLKVETGNVAAAPVFLIGANVLLLMMQNFVPPIFPFAGAWQDFFVNHLPSALATRLDQIMELGLLTFKPDLMQIEEHAGLGFGVSALLLLGIVAVRFAPAQIPSRRTSLWLQVVRWSPLFSLLVLISHSWVGAIGREITPYYALLLPLLLTQSGQVWLVNQPWWRQTAGLVFMLAAGLLVLSPARPLFPVQSLANSPSLPERVRAVYSVYRDRSDAFAPVRTLLPDGLGVLGLVTYDEPETSLWRPFGGRRIEHICPADTLADLQRRNVQYVLMNENRLLELLKTSPEVWQQQMQAKLVGKVMLNLRASTGPREWVVLKLPPANASLPNPSVSH